MPDVSINVRCPKCQQADNVIVDYGAFRKWQDGTLSIQVAFPELSDGDRERLITGWCDECWNGAFGED